MKFWLVIALFSLVALIVGTNGQEEVPEAPPAEAAAPEEAAPEATQEVAAAEDTAEAALEATGAAEAESSDTGKFILFY